MGCPTRGEGHRRRRSITSYGLAADNGVQVLDTAAVYGDSEVVLGKLLPSDHDFRIVTKNPKF